MIEMLNIFNVLTLSVNGNISPSDLLFSFNTLDLMRASTYYSR